MSQVVDYSNSDGLESVADVYLNASPVEKKQLVSGATVIPIGDCASSHHLAYLDDKEKALAIAKGNR